MWPALERTFNNRIVTSQETKPHYRSQPEQMLQIITFTNMTTTKRANTCVKRDDPVST